ncbi:HD-GYP domain-containing protein [Maridesulfovibrio frigidus]|uniref:HD-GYP domain-containing protein n=1 Tax=Maridesulfovibrio frigidus TaxID=340956 RepID=UPI0004E19565|nr:HD-GYP domain-containing protein [Maridesulfovibrio frigidus]
MLKKISVKRVQLGMYIHLKDVSWFDHSFLRSKFLLKEKSEIADILGIGCDYVYYDPAKSSTEPLVIDTLITKSAPKKDAKEIKKKKASALKKRKENFVETEKKFYASALKADEIMQGILSGTTCYSEKAQQMSHELAIIFSADVQATLNLINFSAEEEGLYYHSLNVSILSCMLGKQLGISESEMKSLAFGALMHDLGKSKIPKKILLKQGTFTKSEVKIIQMHPLFGVGLLSGMKSVDRDVMKIIYHHHVRRDGTGYPLQITFDKVSLLPKIVSIIDIYDNLINNRRVEKSLTPHQALATIYGKWASKLDENVLGHFIRMLGIYPPGSICRLDSGEIALVVSIGENPLLPDVILYDSDVPKNDAMILTLGEDIDSKIDKILSPKDLNPAELSYLSPKSKIGYSAEVKQ